MILNQHPTQNDLIQSLIQLRRQAEYHHHRYAVLVSGTQDWARSLVQQALRELGLSNTLWVGNTPGAGSAHRHPGGAHTILGQEYDAVVQDAHDGFDADDFGALTGVVRAGGLFMILAPDFTLWLNQIDPSMKKMQVAGYDPEQIGHRFIQRLCHLLDQDQDVLIIRQQGPMEALPIHRGDTQSEVPFPPTMGACATQDQAKAVASITDTFSSEDESAVVLISDRGRGKSSALGIAAADLIKRGACRILITAPRLTAVNAVFERVTAALPNAEYQSGSLSTAKSSLSFYAPDELIRHPLEADLLMVDEAAAIPGQLLSQLLDRYPKVVFATTVHGYEGSGRGFELRFSRVLDLKRPAWKRLRMSQPVRWAEHDPLEVLSFRALLMDASPTSSSELLGLRPEACRCEHVNRNHLVNDESSLKDLFGLLVTAHYRTRPFDLRYLLDAPNVSIYVLRWGGHIVATAMLAREGSFDDITAQSIYAGFRRPRGHLLAQSLSAHVGVELAAAKSFMRVVRIAVHPEFQGRGLGSALLKGIIEDVEVQGLDAIGASFAADNEVLKFWHQAGFHAVHLGMSQEHTSGSHSVMMLRPLSPTGQPLYEEARQRFTARLRVLLNDALAGLDQSLRHQLLEDLPAPAEMPDTEHELLAYAYARRGFEVSLYAIQPFIQDLYKRSLLGHLDTRQRTLLELRVLQYADWKDIVNSLDLSGKREAQDLMRQTLAQLIDQTGSAGMLRYRDVLKELEGELEARTG